ncbi:hypothetical protein L873DRAFT_115655 [Choiromyces venosus 120613-1]|uniref:Uncharacterized protein n=1 Tax=Choiromyces venosus 120613-1 TaxID=1336337 RepID=A0A3N4J3P2_9PEZI|nr:hypothetical protein L873DRAFT_115655 [Choiromyces venosus 120613-1]
MNCWGSRLDIRLFSSLFCFIVWLGSYDLAILFVHWDICLFVVSLFAFMISRFLHRWDSLIRIHSICFLLFLFPPHISYLCSFAAATAFFCHHPFLFSFPQTYSFHFTFPYTPLPYSPPPRSYRTSISIFQLFFFSFSY